LTRDSNMLGALKFYLLGVNGAGEMPITWFDFKEASDKIDSLLISSYLNSLWVEIKRFGFSIFYDEIFYFWPNHEFSLLLIGLLI
jgi:hypothetical protein